MRGTAPLREGAGERPLLEVRNLVKRYPVEQGSGRTKGWVDAVDRLSFDVRSGETLGLVGESGCGKSTVARAVLRLVEPTAGSVVFDGDEVTRMDRRELRAFRRRAQPVFQNPAAALDPRLSAGATLEEVLEVHGWARARRRGRAVELLEQVGMSGADLDAHPHALSGGQRQRLGIARALAVEPELLVLDEPVSALDVSVRAQIVRLLEDLRGRLGLTYVFIAHDLELVGYLCDRVVVMYRGRAVEVLDADDLDRGAAHPYTRSLLDSVPRIDGPRRSGHAADPAARAARAERVPGTGCPWFERCRHPRKGADCLRVLPPLEEVSTGHEVACIKVAEAAKSRA